MFSAPSSLAVKAPGPTRKEHYAAGKALRAACPRESHAGWKAPSKRRDAVELVLEAEKGRVPDLLPLRHGRMVRSAFTFYRGAALTMAADLATTPPDLAGGKPDLAAGDKDMAAGQVVTGLPACTETGVTADMVFNLVAKPNCANGWKRKWPKNAVGKKNRLRKSNARPKCIRA